MDIQGRLSISVHRRIFACKKALFRLSSQISGNDRPASDPFISGDSFRALAQHAFDSVGKDTALPSIQKRDIVFVASTCMKEFFESMHPRIREPYILITHNGDEPVDQGLADKIDGKIIHWFAQNADAVHPRLTPIPIGIENLSYYQNGPVSVIKRIAGKAKAQQAGKLGRILYHFKVKTNPAERQPALDYFKGNALSETIANKLPQNLYLKVLASYMFVASPPGNGIDCIRTWEALYLRTVPIVKRSVAMEYFKSLGLPLLMVQEWNELNGYTEDALTEAYKGIMSSSAREPLYMDYWKRLIETRKKEHADAPRSNKMLSSD